MTDKLKERFAKEDAKETSKKIAKGIAIGLSAYTLYKIGYFAGTVNTCKDIAIGLNECFKVNPDLEGMLEEAVKIASERMES